MKKINSFFGWRANWSLIIGFILIVLVWFSAIYWVPLLSEYVSGRAAICSIKTPTAEEIEACSDILTKYGVMGDLFGAVTSLFSALGLFAVAITLRADSQARKVALKPFVVFSLGENGIVLENPEFVGASSVNLKISFVLANTGELALNVCVKTSVSVNDSSFDLGLMQLETPLVEGVENEQKTECVLNGAKLNGILTALQKTIPKSNGEVSIDSIGSEAAVGEALPGFVQLNVEVHCNSLEEVGWKTSVSYFLRLASASDRDKIIAVLHVPQGAAETWNNKATVTLIAKVVPNSWRYDKV